MVRQALETLPLAWREVIILRELEGLSYKQIADVAGAAAIVIVAAIAGPIVLRQSHDDQSSRGRVGAHPIAHGQPPDRCAFVRPAHREAVVCRQARFFPAGR